MASPAGHAAYMRRWRQQRRVAMVIKSAERNKAKRGKLKTDKAPATLAMPSAFRCERLRQFQQWYRNRALPHQRTFHASADFVRSLRLPVSALPAPYLAALMSFWWMDDRRRDAVGWLLTDPKPNWAHIRRLLTRASVTAEPAAQPRRRGLGALPSGVVPRDRAFTTVRHWHSVVVEGNVLEPLARKMPTGPKPRLGIRANGKMSTSDAASVLAGVRGVGPYLAKNIINTLFWHGFLVFDRGVVGPGALTTLTWLRGGSDTLQSQGLWPMARTTQADSAQQDVAQLAMMESCHWLDMQHALCLWRSRLPE